MSPSADDLVEKYLKQLDRELRGLPRARRKELVQEISEHVAAGRAELPGASEAELRTLLDRIGEPADIGAEARERFGMGNARAGQREVWALILISVGSFAVPVVGWIVGVTLLWGSRV